METAEQVMDDQEATGAAGRDRSTIAFPYADLEDVVKMATAIHEVGGTQCQIDQLAAKLSVKADTGAFRTRLSAGKTFGVFNNTDGWAKLTPLGLSLFDPSKQSAAKAQAFLQVELYRSVYDRFKGATLPPSDGIENVMVQLGVAPKQAGKARQVFQRSAKQAGFFWSGADRLVVPAGAQRVVDESGGAKPDAGQRPDGSRVHGGGGGGGGHHQLIEGLIKTLPTSGSEWSLDERHKWLQLAAGIFDFVYLKPSADSGQLLLIELKSK